jgi:phosphatidylglycerophosphatase A
MTADGVSFRLRDPRQLLALGFGSGLSPRAPGTAGSLAALPLIVALAALPLVCYLIAVAVAIALGVWVCGATARAVGVHDHGAIVWDEITGMLIAMIALPVDIVTLVVAFGLFRVFDVAKPWPIGWLDRRLSGGWGIMLDDVLAGVAALGGGHALAWWGMPALI